MELDQAVYVIKATADAEAQRHMHSLGLGASYGGSVRSLYHDALATLAEAVLMLTVAQRTTSESQSLGSSPVDPSQES